MKSYIKISSAEIPADILSALESMPDSISGSKHKEFKPWQDAVLLKYWHVKKQQDISKLIGRCIYSCRERYNELKKTAQ